MRQQSHPAAPGTATGEQLVTDYLRLGLRLGRLADGFVDCWFGDAELARQVDQEPKPNPLDLAAQARGLIEHLPDSGLVEPRQRFLAAQLTALECAARRMAGVEIPFHTEIEAYFQVSIEVGDPQRYADVHDSIAELVPGSGSLLDRVGQFMERNHVPPESLERCVLAVSERLRALVTPLFGLPEREHLTYRIVHDKPWNAFNHYHGGLRSTVEFNATSGRNIAALPVQVTHESYPGHHTDHCVKEAELVVGRGWREHTIALVNTPQCLIAEGMGEAALYAVMPSGWGAWTEEILAEHGVRVEGELVEQMLALIVRLLPARQDAAILLHDKGADPDDVINYLRRWLLLTEERARHMVRFLTDPLWRAYTTTYIEGAQLVGQWMAARPAGQSAAERYDVLLREPLLPADLAAAL
ncbi:DUF885 domain-containing protein [Actinosynnema sp. ALI-1.44]|uniref:DUF885 domain-containing protein n=1 Tax=Actinosynnema sp. ALI-1.44 TaxID=1933779 RepID=UPI00097C1593|nr:DUF885 domain-containing protein [Actinosynnema sp. ALI-1.44]ONI76335.1 DUF885 domain-containing protein [Actinosynnema sp. ALI-1.44]